MRTSVVMMCILGDGWDDVREVRMVRCQDGEAVV